MTKMMFLYVDVIDSLQSTCTCTCKHTYTHVCTQTHSLAHKHIQTYTHSYKLKHAYKTTNQKKLKQQQHNIKQTKMSSEKRRMSSILARVCIGKRGGLVIVGLECRRRWERSWECRRLVIRHEKMNGHNISYKTNINNNKQKEKRVQIKQQDSLRFSQRYVNATQV